MKKILFLMVMLAAVCWPAANVKAQCAAPTNFTVSNVTATSALVTWTPSTSTNVQQYTLYRSVVPVTNFYTHSNWDWEAGGWGSANQDIHFNWTDLDPGTTYYCYLITNCTDYSTSDTVSFTFSTLPGCKKPVVTLPQEYCASNIIYFNWTNPNFSTGDVYDVQIAQGLKGTFNLNDSSTYEVYYYNDINVGSRLGFNNWGVEPNTDYSLAMRVQCSDESWSPWSKVLNKHTACEGVALPYAEDFDSYTGNISNNQYCQSIFPSLPECWTFFNTTEASCLKPVAFLTSSNTLAKSGNGLMLYSTPETPIYAMLPKFTGANGDPLELSFYYSYMDENLSGTLTVGYITSYNGYYFDPNSFFVAVDSCPVAAGMTLSRLTISNLPEHARLAFRFTAADESYGVVIDEVTVTSPCMAVALPYTENFNSYTQGVGPGGTNPPQGYPSVDMPDCWKFINRSEDASSYPLAFINNNQGRSVTGNSMHFQAQASTPIYSILPPFEKEIYNLKLSFYYMNSLLRPDYPAVFSVGYMTDPEDESTFVEIQRFGEVGTMTPVEVSFNNIPAGLDSARIAFKYIGTVCPGHNYIYHLYIDEVMVVDAYCAAVATLPYTEDFDSYTEGISTNTYVPNGYPNGDLPACWTFVNRSGNSSGKGTAFLTNYYSGVASGNGLALRASGSNNSIAVYGVLPYIFEDIHDLMLSFHCTSFAGSTCASVGYMTDPSDESTFVTVEYLYDGSLKVEKEILFNTVPANIGTAYIAFKCDANSPYTNSHTLIIDNVTVEMAPTCRKLRDLAVTATTANSATLSWTDINESSTQYRVAYGPEDSFDLSDSSTYQTVVAYEGTTTVTGLAAGTKYTFAVRTRCDATDWSVWSSPVSARTECDPVMALPYIENFDSYTQGITSWVQSTPPATYPDVDLPECWTFFNRSVSTGPPYVYLANDANYMESGNSLILSASPYRSVYSMLPAFGEDIHNLKLSFSYRNQGVTAGNGNLAVGYMTDPTDETSFVLIDTFAIVGTMTPAELTFENVPANVTNARITFSYTGDWYKILAIDNLKVENIQCPSIATLPFTENFDSYTGVSNPQTDSNNLPECWHYLNSSTSILNSGLPVIFNNSLYASSGNNSLIFSTFISPDTTIGDQIAILPQIDIMAHPMNTLRLSFDARGDAYMLTVVVGVISDPTDKTTFVPVGTISTLSNAYKHYEIPFSHYTGSGSYIAIMAPTFTTEYNEGYIDNIVVDVLPACITPMDLTASNITPNSITLSWTEMGTATAWDIEYGPIGFTQGNGTVVTVSSTSYTATGLTPSTGYDFYVRAKCGDNNVSNYTNRLSTSTECLPIGLPYAENFDAYDSYWGAVMSTLPFCWNRINSGTNYTGFPSLQGYASFAASGKNFLWFQTSNYSSCDDQYAVLPQIDVTTYPMNTVQLSLDARRYDNDPSYPFKLIVGVMTNPTDRSTFVAVDSIVPESTTYATYTVSFSDYADTGSYIALMIRKPTSGDNAGFVDNLEVTACSPVVVDAQISQVTGTSALVTWTEDSIGSTGYTITCTETGTNDSTSMTVTGDSYMLSGLTPETDYTVTITSVCNNGTYPALTKTFTTTCLYIGEIQIGEGTTTSYSVPVHNSYKYTYSEQIFLASELNRAGDITSISFDYAYSTAITKKTNVDIYLKHTTQSAFSSTSNYVDTTGAQLVYHGALNCQKGWNTFDFTTPFHYNGTDNLVLIVDDNSNDYHNSSYTFNTHTTNTAMTLYYYHNSYNPEPGNLSNYSGNKGKPSYRNNVIFGMCDPTVTCIAPNVYVSDATENSISLAWAPGNHESSWELEYSTNNTTWTSVGTVTSSPYTITNLSNSTLYYIRMRSVCGGGEYSDWTTISQHTVCGLISSLPLIENFDSQTGSTSSTPSTNNLPYCWSYLNGGTNTNYSSHPFIYASTASAASGSNAMRFYTYSTSGNYDDQMAILPQINPTLYPTNNLQLSFDARNYSSYTFTAVVGVIPDPTDKSTFVPVDTIVTTSSSYTHYEIPFSLYSGAEGHIAIMAPQPTASYNSGYIDNIVVNILSSCIVPINVTASNPTPNSIDLAWTDMNSASSWEIEYGPTGFTQGTGTTDTVTSNAYTVGNLNPSTVYDFYVRANCSSTDVSTFSMVCTAGTECTPISSLPFTENFDARMGTTDFYPPTNNLPYCWSYLNAGTNTNLSSHPFIYASTASAASGSNAMRFYTTYSTSGSYDDQMAILPQINSTLYPVNSLQLSFDARNYSSYTFTAVVGVIPVPTDKSTFVPVDTIVTTSNTYTHYEIPFSQYNGPEGHIAIMAPQPTSSYNSGYIDNIMVDMPSCIVPINVTASNPTPNSIDLAWTEMNNASSWEIEYGPTGFTQGNGTTVTATSNLYTVSGLNSSTVYDFYVRANCGGTDVSTFSTVCTYSTECMLELPYFDNFDAYTGTTSNSMAILPHCWSQINTGTSNSGLPHIYSSTTYAASGSNSLRFYTNSPTSYDDQIAVLPQVDISSHPINTLQLSLDARRYSSTNPFKLMVGIMTNPTDRTTFEIIDSIVPASNTYAPYTISFSTYTGTGSYIALMAKKPTSGHNWGYVDNLEVTACAPVVVDVTHPFTDDFEIDHCWQLVNGTNTNAWVWDTAVNNGGSKALYISNDGGATNAYDNTAECMVYATKLFSLTAGEYTVRYDWKCKGEDGYDYLRVALVPDSITLTAGSSKPSGFGINSLPTGWIAMDGGAELNISSVWKTFETDDIVVPADGNYNVVFAWYDDYVSGENPPAAVDNFSLSRVTCTKPLDLTVQNITPNSATVQFTYPGNAMGFTYALAETANFDVTNTDQYTNTFDLSNLVTGLAPYTHYTVAVRANCGNSSSNWTKPVSFETTPDCGAQAFRQFVVGIQTSTSSYVPLYSNTYDTYGASWQIFKAEEILEGSEFAGTIKGLAWKADQDVTIPFQIFMANTGKTKFTSGTDTISRTTMTKVYDGTTQFAANRWSEVIFDTPFNYDADSNLLIMVYRPAPKLDYNVYFQSSTFEDTVSLFCYGNLGLTSGYRTKDRSNTRFTMCVTEDECMPVENLTLVNITDQVIVVSWTDTRNEGSPNYLFEVGPAGFTPGTGAMNYINGNNSGFYQTSMGPISPSTTYDFYVTTNCGAGNTSIAKKLTVTTECSYITELPYTCGFEAEDGVSDGSYPMPDCWHRYNDATTTSNYYPYVYSNTSYANHGNSSLYFYGPTSTSYADNQIAVLPPVLASAYPMNGNQMVLWAKSRNSDPSTIQVGTMTNSFDGNTFVVDATLELTPEYREYVVPFSSTGQFPAIRMQRPSGSNSYNAYVDDVTIEVVPACAKPLAVKASGFTQTGATISWTPGEDETAWEVRCESLDGTLTHTLSATATPFNFTGLQSGTKYNVSVRAVCDAATQSAWSTPYTFATLCGATGVPYTEDFDSYTEYASTGVSAPKINPTVDSLLYLPDCWSFLNLGKDNNSYPEAFMTSYSGYASSGNALFFLSSNTTPIYAALPAFDEDLHNLTLNFTYRNENVTANDGVLSVGYMTDLTNTTTFVEIQTFEKIATLTLVEMMFDTLPASASSAYIVFKYTGGSNAYYLSIDNVFVEMTPTCRRPHDVQAINATSNSIELGWTETGSATAWEIAYGAPGFDPNANGTTIVTANSNPYTVSGLNHSTSYDFYVRARCSSTDTSPWSFKLQATTTMVPVSLPYTADFTDANDAWVLNNGSCTNYWMRGTVDGEGALFVTNDGTTPGYNVSSASVVSAQKLFTVGTSDTITVTYDVQVKGESSYDYLKMFLSPATEQYPAYNSAPSGSYYGKNNYSSYAYDFYANSYGTQSSYHYILSELDSTIHVVAKMPNPNADPTSSSTAQLVFAWNNDGSVGTQPPAIIKNLTVTVPVEPCPPIAVLPYTENFDTYVSATYPNCWNKINTYSNDRPSISTSYPYNGKSSLYFYTGTSGTYNIAVMPKFDTTITINTLQATFMYKAYSNTDQLVVGVMTDPTDAASFVAVDTVYPANPASNWIEKEVLFSGYTGNGRYIAFKNAYTSKAAYAYIDSLNIDLIPTCPKPHDVHVVNATTTSIGLGWTEAGSATAWEIAYGAPGFNPNASGTTIVTANSNPYTISGLNNTTTYDIYVRARCSGSDVSNWSSCLQANTVMVPVALPYTADFTNASDNWLLNSGSCYNYWMRGTVDNEGALFVTTNGSTPGYNGTKYSVVSTQKLFTVGTSDTITITFDVLVKGESHFDYLKMFLAPASEEYPASTLASSGTYGYDNYVSYAYDFLANGYGTQSDYPYILSKLTDTIHVVAKMPNPNANPNSGSTAQLVFAWKNDNSYEMQPPAIIKNLTVTGTMEPCEPIAVLPYTENFEGYTESTTPLTGVEPTCWELVQPDVAMANDNRPQLFYKSSVAHSGDYFLRLYYRGLYAMPALADTLALNTLKLDMYLAQPKSYYKLQVGVLEGNGTFTVVETINNSSTDMEHVEVDFSGYSGSGKRIAFRNINTNSSSAAYSYNFIDDITLTKIPATCDPITLPYSENFDGYTTSTTPLTGVEPTCWELVHEDVTMANDNRPQLFYKSSVAHSGDYFLRLYYRGVYAMPALADTLPLNTLKLDMYLTQTKSYYKLQVGVWEENGTFTLVQTVNNSSTDMEHVEVDFSGYSGSGKRIAFRNINTNSSSAAYSYNFIDDITLTKIPAPCEPITLPYSDNFDTYTESTVGATGVEPDCWELVLPDVAMTDATRPQLFYKSEIAHSGDYFLRLWYRGIYAMPALADTLPLNTLKLEMYLTQPKAYYTLQVGVWENDGSFTLVQTINNSSTDMEHVEVDFSGYSGSGKRIAFRNINTNSSSAAYSYNFIDDVTLSVLNSADPCVVISLPFTEDFEDYTESTAGATGVEPDCWELVHPDVAMTDATRPQLFYKSEIAHSGDYFLRLWYRGIYAMPALAGDVPLNTLKLEMYLAQPKSQYTLQVGVWENDGTFTLVQTIDNSSTQMEYVKVDFSSYTGSGNRIAFRNVNANSSTVSYAYNYIDDIMISDRCEITSFPYTEDFENFTESTVGATGVEPDCWELVHPDVAMTDATRPQLFYKSEIAHSGDYFLRLWYRGIYAMPALAGDVPLNTLKLEMYLAQPKSQYTLQVGVWENDGTFTLVKTIDNSSTQMEYVKVDFSSYTGSGNRIAFRNVNANSSTVSYAYNYIDDIMISDRCEITSFPYTEDFENFTESTVGATGVEPDCWELVHPDVAMTDATRPQLFYKSEIAHSGDYFLRLWYRGIYAMPALAGDIPLNTLKLEMYLAQPKSQYTLQVGVWENDGTFTLVQTIDNSSTQMEFVNVDFSSYTGSGKRIAFRNVNANSSTVSYAYNYIDDITLSRIPDKLAEVENGGGSAAMGDGSVEDDVEIGTPMGVDGFVDDLENLAVYPNPTTGVVNVQWTMNNVQVETAEIHVLDAYGKLVNVVKVQPDETVQIDLSHYARGVYFVKAVADGNVVGVKKVVRS